MKTHFLDEIFYGDHQTNETHIKAHSFIGKSYMQLMITTILTMIIVAIRKSLRGTSNLSWHRSPDNGKRERERERECKNVREQNQNILKISI